MLPSKFSTLMKIEIGKMVENRREDGMQVALCLEDVLSAVSSGKPYAPGIKVKKQIKNKAMIE